MLHERCGKNGVMGPLIGEITLFELGHDSSPTLHDITAVKESKPLPQQFNMSGCLDGIQWQPENPWVAKCPIEFEINLIGNNPLVRI